MTTGITKTTRAKFVCQEVTKKTGWGENPFVYDAKLQVVYGDNEENKKFFAATPAGSISLATVRDGYFEPGKTYYVDFTEVS